MHRAARGAKRLGHVSAGPGHRYVVAASVENDHVGHRPVRDLGLEPGVRLSRREAIRERAGAVGPSHELGAWRDHDAVSLGYRVERVDQRALRGQPELVRVRVDHPVGLQIGRGEAGHPRQPFRPALAVVGARLVDHVGEPRVGVAAEDLGGVVGGAVVGDHEVADPERVVEAEIGLEDVSFVSNLERHHQARSPV